MRKKYFLKIKDIFTKEQNEKDLREFLEKFSNIFTCVWINKDIPNLFNGRYFPNIREIKRAYPGQSYIFYPIEVGIDNKLSLCINDDNTFDGYIVVSKRGFRTEYSHLKYDKLSVLKDEIDKRLGEFVEKINLFQTNYLFECSLCDSDTNEVLDTIMVRHTDNKDKIVEYVVNNTKILDADIENISSCII